MADGIACSEGMPGSSPGMTSERTRLPLHVLLFRGRRWLVAGADDTNLIAVGDTVRRCRDDAIFGHEAGGQLDLPAEVAGDRHRLEQYLVVGSDGRDPKAALVENERAGRNMQRHDVTLQRQADAGIAARHQFAARVVERELHARGARGYVNR